MPGAARSQAVMIRIIVLLALLTSATLFQAAEPAPLAQTHARIRAALDAVPAIDTHDHLFVWTRLERGRQTLFTNLWTGSYTNQLARFPAPQAGETASAWWRRAEPMTANVRATGFYRFMWIAFRDLYGVDFDVADNAAIDAMPARVAENYRDRRWLYEVITERANIELMLTDPWWGYYEFTPEYPFEVPILRVNAMLNGFHRSEFAASPANDIYRAAERLGVPVTSLDEYVALLDRMMADGKARGVVGLKTTHAYTRTLHSENVSREAAAAAFGRPRSALSAQQVQDFGDFVMWRVAELAAKHDLPFQIHTGHGRLQGSNPLLLLDLIQANPRTKFVLFHGGYPWVGETGAIGMRHWRNVWIDGVWLPTISPTMARRALHEWLEVMPSDRLLWGADCNTAEAIYGATVVHRAVISEVLAEKVHRGDLRESDALRIGRQILRENALALYPTLKDKLWKHRAHLTPAGLQAK